MIDPNKFFKSKTDELIFYLTQLSGESQLGKLGITLFHYRNKECATKWFSDTKMQIDQAHPESAEAIAKLSIIYRDMISEESDRDKEITILYNLNDSHIMSTTEAGQKWGITESRIRQVISRFPEGTIRKFGKQWVVLEQGMCAVFGEPKTDLIKKERFIHG